MAASSAQMQFQRNAFEGTLHTCAVAKTSGCGAFELRNVGSASAAIASELEKPSHIRMLSWQHVQSLSLSHAACCLPGLGLLLLVTLPWHRSEKAQQ